MTSWINLHALWQIVVFGLLAGAGLPAIFAVGLRAAALTTGPDHPADSPRIIGGNNPPAIAAAVLCFAIVTAAIGYGVYFIVQGS